MNAPQTVLFNQFKLRAPYDHHRELPMFERHCRYIRVTIVFCAPHCGCPHAPAQEGRLISCFATHVFLQSLTLSMPSLYRSVAQCRAGGGPLAPIRRAHGVVVSRLLRMQKALGSNPSGSIFPDRSLAEKSNHSDRTETTFMSS